MPVKKSKASLVAKVFEKSLAARPAGKYLLRLFLAGATDRSRQALLRVRQLCEGELKDNCELQVIDIYQQPDLARAYQIGAPVHRQPSQYYRDVD
jgi:circadian clock protein KaiB